MPEITIVDACSHVVETWRSAGVLAEQSVTKFDGVLERFGGYAAAFGVLRLVDVDGELVAQFIRARGRRRSGEIAEAAVGTMQIRRAVLRAFYRTARQLRLTWDDPARDVELPHREARTPRPLTEAEADLVWLHAWAAGGRFTRHAATAALLFSGAHSGEVGHVTVADLDVVNAQVWLHGASRYTPRHVSVAPKHFEALVERVDTLKRQAPHAHDDQLVLATGAGGSDANKQARVCVTAADLLTEAGLGRDGALRPSSMTAVAGVQAFAVASRIEDAARVLGLASLDAAARSIGWQWRGDV
ncbi:integrase [Cellulomonas biazotea]|nr:integrase [Cellulomonas biazotea]